MPNNSDFLICTSESERVPDYTNSYIHVENCGYEHTVGG